MFPGLPQPFLYYSNSSSFPQFYYFFFSPLFLFLSFPNSSSFLTPYFLYPSHTLILHPFFFLRPQPFNLQPYLNPPLFLFFHTFLSSALLFYYLFQTVLFETLSMSSSQASRSVFLVSFILLSLLCSSTFCFCWSLLELHIDYFLLMGFHAVCNLYFPLPLTLFTFLLSS